MASTNKFHFRFSLSTLNHLGRGLYRVLRLLLQKQYQMHGMQMLSWLI